MIPERTAGEKNTIVACEEKRGFECVGRKGRKGRGRGKGEGKRDTLAERYA